MPFDKNEIIDQINQFLNKLITKNKPSLFESEIYDVIKFLKKDPHKTLKNITIIAGVFLLFFVAKTAFAKIYIAILIGTFIFFAIQSFKRKKTKKLLRKAIKYQKNGDYKNTIDILLKAYKMSKNDKIWEIIIEYIKQYPPNKQQQHTILLTELKKEGIKDKKDKKLSEILQQIANTSNYIKKHLDIINNVIEKIKNLKIKLIILTNEKLLAEYQDIIQRYENIIELEKAKINFYEKAKDELHKLKENHLITNQLHKEKEELKTFEDQILEKTVAEQYNTEMTVNEFIIYENAYLDALNEYSESISTSGNQNIFKEMTDSFKTKTKLI